MRASAARARDQSGNRRDVHRDGFGHDSFKMDRQFHAVGLFDFSFGQTERIFAQGAFATFLPIHVHAEIFEQQARADAGAFKNHRQAAARMRAAADEIHAVQILKAVVRAEMQHLVERVREVERRPAINFVAVSQSAGVMTRS